MSDQSLFGYELRRAQREVLAYEGGRMAISAVPGSGKTLTLALLAARLIVEGDIGSDAEVLVVTVQNSAVANISQRIRRILVEAGLPPVGFYVCTLHKLANDVLRTRQDLAGIEESSFIVDDTESRRMMHNAVDVWISAKRDYWMSFVPPEFHDNKNALDRWRSVTEDIGRNITKLCKQHRLTPDEARERLGSVRADDAFVRMGLELYALHARYLQAGSGLDFDDLIWRALVALEQDQTFLANLRRRWPYILEDEAQDSSPLQEETLERLCGGDGNWVRVGDPNQSINSTFTSADPRFFRRFCQRADVHTLTLDESGRCGQPIYELANRLVRTVCESHPEPPIRAVAFEPQRMRPTEPGDPQQNPAASESRVSLWKAFSDVDDQTAQVAHWAAQYTSRYPERTVAVLCPSGWQGDKVVETLQMLDPPVDVADLLKTTPRARNVARLLASALQYLADPTVARHLAVLYSGLAKAGMLGEGADGEPRGRQCTLVRSMAPQNLLFPRASLDLADAYANLALNARELDAMGRFAQLVARWVRGVVLPGDQLLLVVGQDLFEAEQDLAICHSLAGSLRAALRMHPTWGLADLRNELSGVASNKRSITGLSLADAGYEAQPGQIAVTTAHRAKGLEWDGVFLLCADNWEFPSTLDDAFRGEAFYMPGRSPAAEATMRMEQILGSEFAAPIGSSLLGQNHLEYIAERLRLLYVAITRARRNLVVTYSDKNGSRPVRVCQILPEVVER